MHRRSFVGTVGVVALAGCLLTDEEWATMENWLEDTLVLVDDVGVALEEWAEDPAGADPSRFDDLAGRTTDHLDRFDEEIGPIRDDLIDETVVPDDVDRSGESIWQTIEEIDIFLQEAEVVTDALADVDGDPDELSVEEETAAETLIEEYAEMIDDAEELVE